MTRPRDSFSRELPPGLQHFPRIDLHDRADRGERRFVTFATGSAANGAGQCGLG
jgi:hypothetical protein